MSIVAYQHGQGVHNLLNDGSHYVAVRYVGGQFEMFNDGDEGQSRHVDSVDEFLLGRNDVLNLITIR